MKVYELDKAWLEKAEKLQNAINNEVLSHIATATVFPCWRGGWRVGYHHIGTFRANIDANIGKMKVITKKDTFTIYFQSITEFSRKWDNVSSEFSHFYRACEIVNLYRYSGLIPKHIAKNHGKILGNKFPEGIYKSKGYLDGAINLSCSYLDKYAKCPDCYKRGFKCTLEGWECKNCKGLYDDFDRYEWIPNKNR